MACRRKRAAALAIGGAGLLLAAGPAAAELRETRTVAGRTVEVTAPGSGGFDVRVDGKVVLVDKDDDNVRLKGSYEGNPRSFVVVEESSGGTACPSLYQVIELPSGGAPPIVTPRLGNCSDLPLIKLGPAGLRLRFPPFGGQPGKTETVGGAARRAP